MVRTIVVPLDGSRFAETAIPIACRLARSARGRLHLLLVHDPASPAGLGAAAAREREERYLAGAATRVACGSGVATDFSVLQGDPADSLAAGIRETGANLVVMATRGRGSLTTPQAGSLAERLLRISPAPLLLVRSGAEQPVAPEGCISTVLAPVDLARDPEATVAGLAAFACLTQAHVTLLHVVAPPARSGQLGGSVSGSQPSRADDPRSVAQGRLDRLADELRARGIRSAARVVTGTDVPAAIVAELARCPFDVVALSPASADEALLNGEQRVTEAVVRRSTKPVLVLTSTAVPAHA